MLNLHKFGRRNQCAFHSTFKLTCLYFEDFVTLNCMNMAQAFLLRSFCAFIFHLSLLVPAYGALNASYSYSNVSEAFPPLDALYTTSLDRAPWLGGQNFTRCCLQAVSESYVVQGGHVNKTGTFIDLSPDELSDAQFPCGAAYNGSDAGAPIVTVPYSWCYEKCGGWQQSTNKVLSQWVQPFVGFILPAAVFCLNVRAIIYL